MFLTTSFVTQTPVSGWLASIPNQPCLQTTSDVFLGLRSLGGFRWCLDHKLLATVAVETFATWKQTPKTPTLAIINESQNECVKQQLQKKYTHVYLYKKADTKWLEHDGIPTFDINNSCKHIIIREMLFLIRYKGLGF